MTVVKTWVVTSRNPRPSHADVNGEVVEGWENPFSNGLLWPGDGTLGPEEAANCRCVLYLSGTLARQPSIRPTDADDARAWGHENYQSWWDNLTDHEREVLDQYKGGLYSKVNRGLRTGEMDSATQEAVNTIEGALRKAPPLREDIVVDRYVFKDFLDEFGDQLKPGAELNDQAFLSTTLNSDAALARTHFEITVPAGTRGAFLDPVGFSGLGRGSLECEMLLARDSRIVITEVVKRGEETIIHATLRGVDDVARQFDDIKPGPAFESWAGDRDTLKLSETFTEVGADDLKLDNIRDIGARLADDAAKNDELAGQLAETAINIVDDPLLSGVENSMHHAGYQFVGELRSRQAYRTLDNWEDVITGEVPASLEEIGGRWFAGAVQDGWSASSSDLISQAAHRSIKSVFKIDDAVLPVIDDAAVNLSAQIQRVMQLGTRTVDNAEDAVTALAESPAMRQYVTVVYERTQSVLAELGMKDSLPMFRGVDFDTATDARNVFVHFGEDVKGLVDTSLRPATSFSLDVNVAENFGTGGWGFMFSADVPLNRIWSLPTTGPGCAQEFETILLGGSSRLQWISTDEWLAIGEGA